MSTAGVGEALAEVSISAITDDNGRRGRVVVIDNSVLGSSKLEVDEVVLVVVCCGDCSMLINLLESCIVETHWFLGGTARGRCGRYLACSRQPCYC